MGVDELVEGIEREGAAAVKEIGKIFHIVLSSSGQPALNFALNLKDGNGSVEFDPPDSFVSTAKITMNLDTFLDIANDNLDGMTAFMNGNLTIKGDLVSVMHLAVTPAKATTPPAAPTLPAAAGRDLGPLQG